MESEKHGKTRKSLRFVKNSATHASPSLREYIFDVARAISATFFCAKQCRSVSACHALCVRVCLCVLLRACVRACVRAPMTGCVEVYLSKCDFNISVFIRCLIIPTSAHLSHTVLVFTTLRTKPRPGAHAALRRLQWSGSQPEDAVKV